MHPRSHWVRTSLIFHHLPNVLYRNERSIFPLLMISSTRRRVNISLWFHPGAESLLLFTSPFWFEVRLYPLHAFYTDEVLLAIAVKAALYTSLSRKHQIHLCQIRNRSSLFFATGRAKLFSNTSRVTFRRLRRQKAGSSHSFAMIGYLHAASWRECAVDT